MRNPVARSHWRTALIVGFLAVVPRPLLAQNLLTNPHLDTNLSGWLASGLGTVFDAGIDANNSATSGSVHVLQTIGIPFGSNANGLRQCISGIVPGSTYDYGNQILLTSAPAGGSVTVELAFFSDTNCTTLLSVVPSGTSVFQGATFQASVGSAVAPAGAQSAQIAQNERTAATPGDFVLNEDEWFFQLATPVPTLPAPTVAGLGLLLAAGGVWMLWRNRRSGALAG